MEVAEMRYKADITAGALKVPESRIIADLLLRGVDAEGWKDAIVKQNVLQARSPATATRLTKLIRGPAGDDGAGPVEAGAGRQGQRGHPCRPRRRREAQPPARRLPRSGRAASSTGCLARRCRTSCGTTTSTAAGSVTRTCRTGTSRPASGCGPRCSRRSPRPDTSRTPAA